MAKIILVTGGARSGKSDFAQEYAEKLNGPHFFIATCQPLDHEMELRINVHRSTRSSSIWKTIEEPIKLEESITKIEKCSTILIDCLTLWVSNLFFTNLQEDFSLGPKTLDPILEPLMKTMRLRAHTVIMVTNEVGLGIVPENPLARKYRDMVGTCNRYIAKQADEVYLVTCGIPTKIK